MITEIALQELKYRVKKLSTWIYFGAMFLITFLVMVSASGGFPGKVIGGNTREWANSPYMLHQIFVNINFIAVLLISAIMGQAIYRDFENKTWQLFFTKPVSKRDYVFGRFIGSFSVVFLISLSMAAGSYLATLMPFVQSELLGPNRFISYFHPYLVSILPTNVVIGLFFFGLVLYSRKMTSVYVGSVILFITYAIAQEMLPDMNNKLVASLVDPFGFTAFDIITKYWTVVDKNHLLMPINGIVLANRLLWLALGIGVFSYFYRSFELVYSEKLPKKKDKTVKEISEPQQTISMNPAWLNTKQKFDRPGYLRALISEIKLEFTLSFRNRYLLLIVSIGLLFLFAMSTVVGSRFGTPTLPVTFEMLEFVLRLYSLVLLIAIIFLSGEMVWRSRTVNMDQVNDSSPMPSLFYYLAKVIALHTVVVALLIIVIPPAIFIQAIQGFFDFKIELYLFDLFVLNMTRFSFFIFLAFFVQILVNSKALGHLLMVLYYVWGTMAPQLGLEHLLFVPMKLPRIIYSDMNGYGASLEQWSWHALSGYGWAIMLLVAGSLMWVRGVDTRRKQRIRRAISGLNRWYVLGLLSGFLVMVVAGAVIIYNTVYLNDYVTKASLRKSAYSYEVQYKQYENALEPSIIDVYSEVDIFPGEHRVSARGTYQLVNSNNVALDSFVISLPTQLLIFGNLARGMEIEKLEFSVPTSQVVADKKLGFYVYDLDQPLLPGDSCLCEFQVTVSKKGFANSKVSKQIVENGTFINSYLLFPNFGYNRVKELKHPDVRKRFNLPPRPRMMSIEQENNHPLISNRANFEAVVSTSEDQIAIAPGKLIKEWKNGNRNYYRYKSEGKIWTFFTFQSARYETQKSTWKEIPVSVYYHQEHDYNVDAMLDGIKCSLDYFTKTFSPFEEGDVKVVEFPRYSSFAMSMPNTIPFSEELGFIANVDRESEDFIDYPFFITSHEVAHHWWGNQVVAAEVQGGLLIDESLAEYSAMMVTEKRYGKDHIRRLKKYKLDRYFEGRSNEITSEMPLNLMEDQGYLHYDKGGLVLHAIQEILGEEAMNRALKSMIGEFRYFDGPLPKSTDLIESIRDETPDDLQNMITDFFERITLYDFRLEIEKVVESRDDKYQIGINLLADKSYVDGVGNEEPAELNDWINIEVYTSRGDLILAESVHVGASTTPIKLKVNQKPHKIVIDPDYHFINKRFDDNSRILEIIEEEESGSISINTL